MNIKQNYKFIKINKSVKNNMQIKSLNGIILDKNRNNNIKYVQLFIKWETYLYFHFYATV